MSAYFLFLLISYYTFGRDSIFAKAFSENDIMPYQVRFIDIDPALLKVVQNCFTIQILVRRLDSQKYIRCRIIIEYDPGIGGWVYCYR